MTTLDTVPADRLARLARLLRDGERTGAGAFPARPDPASAPLAPQQLEMWVHGHFLSDDSFYGTYQALWLDGPLDVEALRAALADVVDRHETLRARFVLGDGDDEPRQLFDEHVEVPLTEVMADDAEAAFRAALDEPYDLARGPLFRPTLIRAGAERHLLVLAAHHIVCDGWSFETIARDLGECYATRTAGGAPRLPALPTRYGDYAHWQRERADAVAEDLRYWRQTLGAVPTTLELPTDRPRPAIPSHRGRSVGADLSREVTTAVRDLAAAHRATVFTTMLTTFGALLSRISGQRAFAVGTLTAGRDRQELHDVVGLFSNTVALPVEIPGGATFADLLRAQQKSVLGALSHQDATFEQVVETLTPQRDLSRNPVFQVLFQHDTADGAKWLLPGLDVTPVELADGLVKTDLALFTVDRGDTMRVELAYAEDLFTADTAHRLLGHLTTLLQAATTAPDTPVDRLPILTEDERRLLTAGWNATARSYPDDVCLHELFERQVAADPSAVAVRDSADGSIVTYGELNSRANRLARHLRTLGIGPDVFVGLCVEHGADMFAGMLAVAKAGGAYVPLDPAHPEERLAFVLADTAAPVLLTQDHLMAGLPEHDAHVIRLDADREVFAGEPDGNLDPVAGPEHLVYSIYTSGSTGRPKGVLITHRGLVNYLDWAVTGYGLGGRSGAPMVGSIAFDLSVPNFFLPLIGGRDVTLVAPDQDHAALADLLLGDHDFSLLKITPAHLDVLRAGLPPGTRLDSVRTYVVGADEVRPDTVAAWRRIAPDARIINEYGPTETVVGCSIHELPPDSAPAGPVPIGKPIANTTMYVLDEHLEPVPIGVVGELYIGGAGVARGYLNRPALTAEKFLPDPHSPDRGARFYRTGDLARFRQDGDLDFLGRIDHQVKINGYRIELGEIESRLLAHPSVAEAVVAARTTDHGRKHLVGYLVAGSPAPDVAEIRAFLARSLPDYMVPATFVTLPELPLSPGGKVDRRLLPAPDRNGAGQDDHVPAETRTERGLAAVWGELFELPDVGVLDNFFALGGDSMLLIQMVNKARGQGLTLEPRQVYRHQTIRELAEVLDRAPDRAPERGADQDETFGLTPMQRFFTDLVAEEGHDLLAEIPLVRLEFAAAVDLDPLRTALTALVERHESLRLRIERTGDGYRQRFAAASPPTVCRVTGLADAADVVRAAIDPRTGPLLAAAVVGHEVLIGVHHLAVDGVSWGVLLDDLAAGLAALGCGAPVELPPVPTPVSALLRKQGTAPPTDRTRAPWPRTDSATGSGELLVRLPVGDPATVPHRVAAATAVAMTASTGADIAVFAVKNHGRDHHDLDLSRTVGWLHTQHAVTIPMGPALVPSARAALRAATAHVEATADRPWLSLNYEGRVTTGEHDTSRPFTVRELPSAFHADTRRPFPVEVTAAVVGDQLVTSWRWASGSGLGTAVCAMAERYRTAMATEVS